MSLSFSIDPNNYVGGRTLTGKESDFRCSRCFKDLKISYDGYDVYWCSIMSVALCKACVLNKHVIRRSHEDIAVDKLEVEK